MEHLSPWAQARFNIVDGRLMVGRLPVCELVERFGTPLYLIDLERVKKRLSQITTGLNLSPSAIYYSVKAYANVEFLRFLNRSGICLDVCSPGDLTFARAAGFSDGRMSYTGHSMTTAEVKAIASSKILFNADSYSQVDRYCKYSQRKEMGLRVNCSVDPEVDERVTAAATHSKFGIPIESLEEVVRWTEARGKRVIALHAHLGSDMHRPDSHLQALDLLTEVSSRLRDIRIINLGGGWAVPFNESQPEYDFAEFMTKCGELLDRIRGVELRVEPGTYVTRDSGYLITSVTEVRKAEKGRSRIIGTDSGTNQLNGPALYGGGFPIAVENARAGGDLVEAAVVGNLMQGGDVLSKPICLPDVEEGSLLAFAMAGAYASCMASNFNERPRPPEVLVHGSRAQLVRRRETVSDLLFHQVSAASEDRDDLTKRIHPEDSLRV